MKARFNSPKSPPPSPPTIDYAELIAQVNRELEHHGLTAFDLLSSFSLHVIAVSLDWVKCSDAFENKAFRDLHVEICRRVKQALDRKQRLLGSPLQHQSLPKERD